MCPGADSYDDLFKVIRRLALPYDASEQQYLRMVFNVLSGNIDDHSKNFSFCMDERGEWTLSSAYDITYSIDHSAPAYMNRHSLLVNGKDSDISLKDVLEVGKRNDIRNARELIGQVKEALAGFDTMASGLGIDTEVIAMVKKEINSRILNLY